MYRWACKEEGGHWFIMDYIMTEEDMKWHRLNNPDFEYIRLDVLLGEDV